MSQDKSELLHTIYKLRKDDNLKKIHSNLKTFLPLPDDSYMDGLHSIKLPSHHMIGTKLKHNITGKEYIIESVSFQYYNGWYFAALMNSEGSHSFRMFQNYSCHDETIVNSINQFQNEFSFSV